MIILNENDRLKSLERTYYRAFFRLDNSVLEPPHRVRLIKKNKNFSLIFECPCKKKQFYFKSCKNKLEAYKEIERLNRSHSINTKHLKELIKKLEEKKKKEVSE